MGSSRLHFQALHLFHGLRRDTRGSALPHPTQRQVVLTTRQASHNATDRSVAPPKRAFDAGLRPDPFPDRAASLLPGLLAATRTGLTPAGDDELMFDRLLDWQPPNAGRTRILWCSGLSSSVAVAAQTGWSWFTSSSLWPGIRACWREPEPRRARLCRAVRGGGERRHTRVRPVRGPGCSAAAVARGPYQPALGDDSVGPC